MVTKIIKLPGVSRQAYTKITAIDTKVKVDSSDAFWHVNKTTEAVKLSGHNPSSNRKFKSASKRTVNLLSAFVPIPQGINFAYDNNWSITNLSAMDIGISKALGVYAEHGLDKTKLTDVVQELGGDWLNILNSTQSIVDVDAINRRVQRGFNVAFNSYKELLYEGPEFRKFAFTWDFAPKTQQDAKNIMEFIDNMAYYSSPDTMTTAYSPYVLPATFEVEFVGTKLPKLRSLVAISVDADYSAAGGPRFFVDGRPAFTRLTVAFMELDRVVKSNFRGVEFDGKRK